MTKISNPGDHLKTIKTIYDQDIPTWVTTPRPSMTKISNLGDHLKTIMTIYDQDIPTWVTTSRPSAVNRKSCELSNVSSLIIPALLIST